MRASLSGVWSIVMASTVLFLLQLLLLASLVSASHHYGGSLTFSYKGRNPDGTFNVALRARDTYDGCQNYHYWYCYTGNCGTPFSRSINTIDFSTNAPLSNREWCETENLETWKLYSDKPFELRAASCCWIPTRNSVSNWRFNSLVDLGRRSDTGEPNRSPDIAILPFLRTPQNCPRTYRLVSFDADGDRVRCRYGNIPNIECDNCNPFSGFQLDQNSCTLHYQYASAYTYVFGFEMVVEDYAQGQMDLFYSDGSKTRKYPLLARRKRQISAATPFPAPTTTPLPTPWWWWTTRTSSTTIPPTTPWWWWTTRTTTTPPATITTTPTTISISPRKTTTATTPPWWWTTTRRRQTTTTAYHTSQSMNPTPLSQLPLQFSFLVDPPALSCQEGAYLPRLVSPTPVNGQHITAEVHKEVEIRVKAEATISSIQNIIMSGPTNITKHRTTNEEFVLKWTPTADDLGDHYSVCFAVEAAVGSSIYQSEMRCVVMDVKKEQIKATVTCTESIMKVEIDRSSFFGLNEDHLCLSDPTNTICNLRRHSNNTHLVAIIPLNACGTQIEEDDDYLIFKNEITSVDETPNELITRKHLVEARFYCQYQKRGNVTLGFTAHRKNVTVWEKGFGTFTYQFEFYSDNQFRTMISPNSYPLDYDIGERIYMQLDASDSVNNTEMFVESCRAAPYDNPNYHPTYSIIENGCKVDPTVQIHSSSNKRQFKFSMEAFKFIGLHDQVYISCTVMMCEAGNSNTRCSQGCTNSTWSSGHSNRWKREALIQSGKHFISQGPLRLKRSADARDVSVVNLNLNTAFIAGCLLAAVGMICGALVYKNKMSKVKYQPLPSDNN